MKKIIVLFMACLLVGTVSCAKAPTWEEQYALGVRYLSEGNYEEAIIAFTAAIEIDPKNAEAYLSAADAYIGLGDEDKAIEILEKGYEQTDSSVIAEKLNKLRLKVESESLLSELLPLFETKDYERIKDSVRQDKYKNLAEKATEGFFRIMTNGEIGLAVYPNNFYYYGQWENDERNGVGIWYSALLSDPTDSYLYDGQWAHDLPNEKGHVTEIWDVNKREGEIQKGVQVAVRREVDGEFHDGLYDGLIYETWYMNDGVVRTWSPIQAENGCYQKIANLPPNYDRRPEDLQNEELIIVAIDQNDVPCSLWYPETNHCIILGLEDAQ